MPDFFSRPIVCNTGPLIALSRASLGGLLVAVFPRVVTTTKVVAELTAKDSLDLGEIQLTLKGLEILEASRPDPLLLTELDSGEASVIQAARDLGSQNVLIDERRARRIATKVYHLDVRGTCGLLVEAKRRALLASVGMALRLIIQGGYFIGPDLLAECLKRAGEA